jgi:excinuclease ABC subunit C
LKIGNWKLPKYFGPYTSASAVKETMKLLKRIFPYRTCERNLSKTPKGRLCLEYHLGRCLGPCEKKCTQKEYDIMIKQAIDFLSGKTDKIINDLKLKMKMAADKKEYERAGHYRDQLKALDKLTIKQRVISIKRDNHDYLNIFKENDLAVVTLFKIRQGKLLDPQNFLLKNVKIFTETELLEQFVNQYYSQTADLPKTLIVPKKIEAPLKIIIAQKGNKKKLLDLVGINAKEYFKQQQTSWEKAKTITDKKLTDLQKILNLAKPPQRIEGYDISNILGNEAVGSLVVMTDGKIDKNEYRRFKIKTILGANDPAMIGEIIKRRLANNWPIPDLILIDGGLAQLNSALKILGNKKIPVIALAKKQEEIYLPNQPIPIKLPKFSPTLQLLQELRDEAHRFAINYHKKLRRKK